jgi:hypothetical protein
VAQIFALVKLRASPLQGFFIMAGLLKVGVIGVGGIAHTHYPGGKAAPMRKSRVWPIFTGSSEKNR